MQASQNIPLPLIVAEVGLRPRDLAFVADLHLNNAFFFKG
jgi:hypothetical protein